MGFEGVNFNNEKANQKTSYIGVVAQYETLGWGSLQQLCTVQQQMDVMIMAPDLLILFSWFVDSGVLE